MTRFVLFLITGIHPHTSHNPLTVNRLHSYDFLSLHFIYFRLFVWQFWISCWTIGPLDRSGRSAEKTEALLKVSKLGTWERVFVQHLHIKAEKVTLPKKNIYFFTNCNQITTNKEKTDFFFICQAGFDCLDFYRSIVLGHLRLDERNPCNVFVSKKSFEFHKLSRFICLLHGPSHCPARERKDIWNNKKILS